MPPKGYKSPQWDVQAELELLKELCRRDFWTFFLYATGAGVSPRCKRWVDPDVHEPIAKWFQEHVLDWRRQREHGVGEPRYLAALIHRRVGKTTQITRAGQQWLHLLDPEIATAIGSEHTSLSMKMLAAMKAVWDGSDPHALFPRLYGNWATQARTWTGKEIVHAARRNTARQDPSVTTFSVETSITGSHPDAIFFDDPISYERLQTDTNWFKSVQSQVESMVPVMQEDGLLVFCGTRYDEEDHFGVAFREEGVASISGMESDSISIDPKGLWHVYFMAGRDKEGRPSTPKVWSEERMRRYQAKNPLKYAAQVMNDPTLSELNPITRAQIGQCVIEKEQVPWGALRYAICCDTAFWDGAKLQGKDETCYYVHGYPRNGSGDVYVIEGDGSNSWREEDFKRKLVSVVQRYRRQGKTIFAITDEVTMAGKKGSWRASLTNAFHDVNEPMPTFYEFDRKGKKKTERMAAAASFWVDGHVRIVKDSPGSRELMEQMAKIGQFLINPRLKNDRADAHSDAFQPELYQPMRRMPSQRAPWDRGANPIEMEGLDQAIFDDEEREWAAANPRRPIS